MKAHNILFIGNSYTYFNGMPTEFFAKIAESAGVSVNITSITKGGWTLEKHADANDVCGAEVEKALFENKYDFVVLQEQSLRPAIDQERFFASVRALCEKIKPSCANVVLYSTWGRKEGSEKLAEIGMSHKEMTEKIALSYRAVAKEVGAVVADVGHAFFNVNALGEMELYHEDKSHPSKSGSFLAALVIFAKMFDFDVREIAFNAHLSKEEAEILKSAAYKVK